MAVVSDAEIRSHNIVRFALDSPVCIVNTITVDNHLALVQMLEVGRTKSKLMFTNKSSAVKKYITMNYM